MLTTIISFIIVLGILIFIHEFGHYITAKKAGIRVEEFALGYGPRLFSRQKGETVYSIRALPLGGFCKMTGEFPEDEEMTEEERKIYLDAKEKGECFFQKSPIKRFAVIFMGPFMNFMLAVLLFILMFSIYGIPVDSSSTTIIGTIVPEKPAAEAGLEPGDKIIEINGTRVENWDEMASIIHRSPGKKLEIKYIRNNEIREVTLIPDFNENTETGVIGIYPELIMKKVSFTKSIKMGFYQTWYVFSNTIMAFVKIITRETSAELAGPIMIANMVGQAAKVGLLNLLNLMAVISINLGILNLLPFPALDGGRIVFILVEVVRGKPVDPEKEGFVHLIGFVLLMVLMVFVIYKDIMRTWF
ncbi:RIP metalloprotease RseP [Halothermothrix orenii]|uniref:Zinc metalloprotease n=1 Tax=Halothermothrix orenii (strain H 168 / OCM 544 / DSM 9562) TaxID=373903 RepID=B8CW62_HALOH|nr:RIP metalloprotease RseP [Halothermothrix orenii]ACL69531.1 putative membrane-associated zinc metalloprotease [Halothermothrix orenii H 168]